MTGRRRLLGGVTAAVFALLVAQLGYLQFFAADDYDELAAGNRTRLIQTEAPRGRILDARGRPLADRRAVLVAVLDHMEVGELSATARRGLFEDLAIELTHGGHHTGPVELRERYEEALGRSLEPIVVASDLAPGLWIALEERGLTGVSIEERSIRTYPNGDVAAHVLGHLGTVEDEAEAVVLGAALDGRPKPYLPGDVVGRDGLEQVFEPALRGTPEIRRVEIDARNRVVRTVEIVQAAVPGDDVHLTIDLDLQREAELAVDDRLAEAATRPADASAGAECADCTMLTAGAGSLVAVRPTDGAVLALASRPAYDPSWFVGGLSQRQADLLFTDEHRPLLNRAIAGLYPPGSTFKPVTAYAALSTGLRAETDIWVDGGTHTLAGCTGGNGGCTFRNAGGVVMGPVDLRAALARSSDTYFYGVGEELWNGRETLGATPIQQAATRFGFGLPTGIGLPGERAGVVPTPEGRVLDGGRWHTGDNVNLAIGQGDLLVTPLQLAAAYSRLARADNASGSGAPGPGTPVLVSHVTDAEGDLVERMLPSTALPAPAAPLAGPDGLDEALLAPIGAGLADVPRTGTAVSAFAGFPLDQVPISGKTGTAEVAGRDDFSLFVGYGTGDGPDLVVAVVLEEAGFGGLAAAPAARRVIASAAGLEPDDQPARSEPDPGDDGSDAEQGGSEPRGPQP